MKILISADMEGATGVTWAADVEPGTAWEMIRCVKAVSTLTASATEGFYG